MSATIIRARLLTTRQTRIAFLALAETAHARATRRLRFVGLAIFCASANRAVNTSPVWLTLALANGNITKSLLRTLTVIFAATKCAISTEISHLANAGTVFTLAMCKARRRAWLHEPFQARRSTPAMFTTALALATFAMLMAAQRAARNALETMVALANPCLLVAVTMTGAGFMFSSEYINSCWASLHLTSISTPTGIAVTQLIFRVPVSLAGASGSLASLALVPRLALACPVGTAAPSGALLHVSCFVSSVKQVGARWALHLVAEISLPVFFTHAGARPQVVDLASRARHAIEFAKAPVAVDADAHSTVVVRVTLVTIAFAVLALAVPTAVVRAPTLQRHDVRVAILGLFLFVISLSFVFDLFKILIIVFDLRDRVNSVDEGC